MKERHTFTLDPDLIVRVDNVRNRIPRSTMVNEILERGLKEYETRML